MFTILNRLRGTWSWMAKVVGIVIGILVYLITSDMYIAVASASLYLIGESFGWGKWIGGVYRKNVTATQAQLLDLEGRNNGVHWLANTIFPERENYYKYCYTALMFRGMLWFGLTLFPLYIGGYIPIDIYIGSVLFLGVGFPVSIRIGAYTETKFSFKSINGFWEQAEVWYGFMQDIVLVFILLSASHI